METLLLLMTAAAPPLIRPTTWSAADNFNWNTGPLPLAQGGRDGVYVIPYSIDGVVFTCNASYPIEWAFQNSQLPPHAAQRSSRGRRYIAVSSFRNSADNLNDTGSFEYLIKIRLTGLSTGLTGNYTCQKVGDESVASSVYVYWEGNAPPFLVQEGQNATAVIDPATNTALIPCTVAKPSVSVELFKRDYSVNASGWTPIPKNNAVTYDPQRGFTLKNLTDMFGKYKCIANSDQKDFATLHVVPASSPEAKPLEFGNMLRWPASYGFHRNSHSMYCCSRTTAPIMMHFLCDHPTTCKIRKESLLNMENTAMRNESCAYVRLYVRLGGIFRCRGDGIDIVREYFFPLGVPFAFARPLGMPANDRSDYPYFRWDSAEASEMISLKQLSTSKVYHGQNVSYGCEISAYFFSQGIRWVLGFANGTEINVKEEHRIEANRRVSQLYRNIVRLVVNADSNLESVTCYAPVWNTSEWKSQTVRVKIWKPVTPFIVPASPGSLEIHEWYLNDTNIIMDCNASGDPLPLISWIKDGKRNFWNNNFTLSKISNSTFVTSRLEILRASHDTQGVYVCIALNFHGSAYKTFQVNIHDPVTPSVLPTTSSSLNVAENYSNGTNGILDWMAEGASLPGLYLGISGK